MNRGEAARAAREVAERLGPGWRGTAARAALVPADVQARHLAAVLGGWVPVARWGRGFAVWCFGARTFVATVLDGDRWVLVQEREAPRDAVERLADAAWRLARFWVAKNSGLVAVLRQWGVG